MQLTITEATNAISALEASLESLRPRITAVIDAADPRVGSEVERIIDEKGREIGKDWLDFSNLCLILEKLGKAVSKANSELGIAAILAEEAGHERRIRYLRCVVNSRSGPDAETLKDALARSKGMVETPVLSEAVLKSYTDKLNYSEQRRNELQTRRRVLCVTNSIEIADSDYGLLKNLGAV